MSEDIYTIQDIQETLPHRYPFLLIDRIIKKIDPESVDDRRKAQIWAIKNVSINEPYFQGHFPGKPIMPGVLLIEVMAQASAFACAKKSEVFKTIFITGVRSVRFRKPVYPGYQLIVHSKVLKQKKSFFVVQSTVHFEEKLMAEAEIMAHVEFETKKNL